MKAKLSLPTRILLLAMLSANLRAEVRVLPTPKFVGKNLGDITFEKVAADFSGPAEDAASLIEIKEFFGNDFVQDGNAKYVATISASIIKAEQSGSLAEIPDAVGDSILNSDEGYFISVRDERIRIFANKPTGVFYAVTTLLQLVEKQKGGYSLPEIMIGDYPSIKLRGISDDISRGQISTMENFKKIIRFLAMYKMNVYMPYLENLFEFKSYPSFSEGRAPLTSDEVAQLDEYAKLYHVQIIPIFETLGHMEDVLQKSEFEKYAEFPGAASLNIGSDSTYEFVKKLLSEIAPAFSSNYFNMAADESFDVGLGASKRLVDSIGIDRAHAQYYKKIYAVLKSLGKEVMMYGDIILKNPGILDEIPKDITIVDWEYDASFDYPTVQKFKEAGFKFIVSPAVENYNRLFPNFYGSYANIEYFTKEGYEAGAVGDIISSWNDNGAADLRELNYPGYAWGAECAWNPVHPSSSKFDETFFTHYFGTNSDLPRLVYELLSSTGNQISSFEFWSAPFIAESDHSIPTRAESIESSTPEILSLIARAREVVERNGDILDLYELVAKMNKYWADKVMGVNEIRNISVDSSMSPEQKRKKIEPIADSLISSISRLKEEYASMYLRTNRRPMLQLIESRFDDQKKGLLAGTQEILSGNASFDQLLYSRFIYYPNSHPYSTRGPKIDAATYLKTLNIPSVPENDTLQLIGDTYCTLFINGSYVGEVQARSTLTWNVEKERVKVFNISDFLHRGENTFVVQARNFDRNGSAGCNVFAMIGNDTLRTDDTWMVAKGIVPPDVTDIAELRYAVPYDNGWLISAPQFSLGLKSRIEK